MPNFYENYRRNPIAQELERAIDTPGREVEFELLSRPSISLPAVQAVVEDVRPIIENLPAAERHAANKFIGWFVGQRMRALGYEIIRPRARVRNAPFGTGAVWGRVRDAV